MPTIVFDSSHNEYLRIGKPGTLNFGPNSERRTTRVPSSHLGVLVIDRRRFSRYNLACKPTYYRD